MSEKTASVVIDLRSNFCFVLDYLLQYVADLEKANANGVLQYRLEYTARAVRFSSL